MAERISLEQVERKAEMINRDFGTDIDIERYNGAYRAVCNKGSKNLTPLTTKRNLWSMLDAMEEGIWLGLKRAQQIDKEISDAISNSPDIKKMFGAWDKFDVIRKDTLNRYAATGRVALNKPNFVEVEKDGRQRTESNGE